MCMHSSLLIEIPTTLHTKELHRVCTSDFIPFWIQLALRFSTTTHIPLFLAFTWLIELTASRRKVHRRDGIWKSKLLILIQMRKQCRSPARFFYTQFNLFNKVLYLHLCVCLFEGFWRLPLLHCIPPQVHRFQQDHSYIDFEQTSSCNLVCGTILPKYT